MDYWRMEEHEKKSQKNMLNKKNRRTCYHGSLEIGGRET